MLVDTHCHIDFSDFAHDRFDVLRRMIKADVRKVLVPGIDLRSSRQIVTMFPENEDIYFAVGVHPNHLDGWDDDTASRIAELCVSTNVVAIGEIGLDYYWDRKDENKQRDVFIEQLLLACSHQLPVVIHTRDKKGSDRAIQDVYDILKSYKDRHVEQSKPFSTCGGVMHSFSYSADWAKKFTNIGFMIGITGPVTYKNAHENRNVVSQTNLEHLLLETDSPFLSPEPFRGKRNEPANVSLIATKIAEIKGLPFHTVAETTTINAGRLFSW